MTAILSSPLTTVVLVVMAAAGAGLSARSLLRPSPPALLPPAPPSTGVVRVRLYARDRACPPPRIPGVEYVDMPFDWDEDLSPDELAPA